MQFHDYPDSWHIFKRHGIADQLNINSRYDMYRWFCQLESHDPLSLRHSVFDQMWNQTKRPYYDVYPSIIPLLTSIDLDIPGSSIISTFIGDQSIADDLVSVANMMYVKENGQFIQNHFNDIKQFALTEDIIEHAYLPHLVVRLPTENNCLKFTDDKAGEVHVKTIFMSFQPVNNGSFNKGAELGHGLVVGMDIGETIGTVVPSHIMKCFPLSEESVEESINKLPDHPSIGEGLQMPDVLINKCIKLCLTLRLIKDDPQLIEPDVLSKDRVRFKTGDDKLKNRLVEKAIRKGKHGFRVGHMLESSETSPHLRRPHPALVWTGKGRKIPKIVMRKGSIVHRDKIKQIPTGYDTRSE
ncbi:MAG: hypothetical protein ACYSYU_00150 [Planctomycetota bacterium]